MKVTLKSGKSDSINVHHASQRLTEKAQLKSQISKPAIKRDGEGARLNRSLVLSKTCRNGTKITRIGTTISTKPIGPPKNVFL